MNADQATAGASAPVTDPPASKPAPTGVALLFPGQGSQTATMRELVSEHRPDLLGIALEHCGSDPFERIDEGTAFAQPALYAASIASWEREGRPSAAALAGHSLGELAALAAAGSIDEADGLRIALARGRMMQDAAEQGTPGSMAALLGNEQEAERLAAELGLAIANRNAPGQLVVSGAASDLDHAKAEVKERGLKLMRLPVTGAFHSRAMEPTVAPFRRVLDDFDFNEPKVPVYSSSTAEPFAAIRDTLAEAIVRPVRWTETLRALSGAGIDRFLEVGPGKVLTGLVRRTLPEADAIAMEASRG